MQRLFPLRAIPYTWNKAAAGFPPWSQAGDNDTHLLKKKQDEIQVVISKTFRTSVNGIGIAGRNYQIIRLENFMRVYSKRQFVSYLHIL